MLIALSSMMVQSHINTFKNEVIAGIGVAEKIIGWGQLPSVSISSATMALVAQNIGAENYEKVRAVIKESLKLSLVASVVLVGLIVAFAPLRSSSYSRTSIMLPAGQPAMSGSRCILPFFRKSSANMLLSISGLRSFMMFTSFTWARRSAIPWPVFWRLCTSSDQDGRLNMV